MTYSLQLSQFEVVELNLNLGFLGKIKGCEDLEVRRVQGVNATLESRR